MRRESLRCVGLELVHVRLPLRFAFRHAAAERRTNDALIVILRTDGGVRGYGEAIPRAYLTGETIASCHREIKDSLWPRLRELTFTAGTRPDVALAPLYEDADGRRQTAAYAGLDVAVHDAWGRAFGIAGKDLVGHGHGHGKKTVSQAITAVVGMGMPPALIGRLYRLGGFRDFKVKVGSPRLADDLARVAAVRRAVGPRPAIRVDANGVWTHDQARTALDHLAELGVESVEQPTAAGDPDELAALQTEFGVPVVADESLCTRADATALLQAGGDVWWNLRVAKVGGITGLKRLVAMAREAGVTWQLGALVGETGLLTAAARACLPLGPARVESSFPELLLQKDVVAGGPRSWTGTAAGLGALPGLGVELRESVLRQVTVTREVVA